MATGSTTAWIAYSAVARITIHEIQQQHHHQQEQKVLQMQQQQQLWNQQHARSSEGEVMYSLLFLFSNHAKIRNNRRERIEIKW